MLPEEDALMYVDVDVVFVRPVEYVWQTFKAMNELQIAAMVLDSTKPEHTRFASAETTLSSKRLGKAVHRSRFLYRASSMTRFLGHGPKRTCSTCSGSAGRFIHIISFALNNSAEGSVRLAGTTLYSTQAAARMQFAHI
ncbi:hypothetical protein HPB48_007921 [Haemaphysalis longicornis]|uniref:Nucleotide-diphospho-sugar transferase domain-containing protein n=1 Tax=Haemaphysalis longicornis TaxID=44386 RepID=A0A9J6F6U7_HAELO|nr:hypothetical protein HPB48_007921 [Haemaphysalis longicornis]